MKREYRAPSAKMIDYTYDEQVVATSPGGSQNAGTGDGHNVGVCTHESGSFADPCSLIANSSFPTSVCGMQPYSIL